MPNKVWEVVGADGVKKEILRKEFSSEIFSKEQIKVLLQCLESCQLKEDEVMDSFSSLADGKGFTHLQVNESRGGENYSLMTTGGHKHYIATLKEVE